MASKTIKDLTKLWEHEKEQYKTAEIGTGVQRFVKHIFECEELFGLDEGKLSTADLKRKNEFLTEARKKGRRADVVIFIDSDIIIPVEVEKHTHIKSGIQQIYNYQGDWTKKYGLLTDGNEWWFYNNRYVEKKFFIKDILENPKEFLTYWKEYTTADFYYRSFFEKKGQLKIFEEPAPNLDDVREDFFTDITNLIENFENKLNLKGYFKKEKDETERKKKAVEITYAYLIQFILYKVLVDNAFGDFEKDWEERLKSIDKAIRGEAYGDVLTKIKGISDKISDKIYKRFNDEQLMINTKLKEILSAPKTDIGDVSVWLDIMLFINRYNFANVQNEIFGYVYENYLKDLYLDEKKGQYFTDPHVVEFMLNEMGYTKDNLQKRYAKDKDSLSIIDPSCGSGTFLYNATHRVVEAFFDESNQSSKLTEQLINDNIFGLDIAEFPLYLAEMNILMRMLPIIISERYNNPIDQKIKVFKTRDSIAEFLDAALKNTISDINAAYKKGKIQYDLFTDKLDLGYDSFMRDKGDLDDLKNSLEERNKKTRTRFDFVVGNPPYVAYNEISQQKLLFVQLMQAKKLQMSDIYGVNLNTVPGRIKAYSPKPNLYSFFIALGLALLKDGGKICYIIPQTILTSTDLDVLRYHLSSFLTIEKIITFSCNMFVGRGIKQDKPIPTSSLIFIVSKKQPQKTAEVEVVNYLKQDDDIVTCLDNIKKKKKVLQIKIPQNKLRQNIDNWNFIKYTPVIKDFFSEYDSQETFDIYRLDTYSKKYFNSNFYFDKGLIYPKDKIKDEIKDDSVFYNLIESNQKDYSLKVSNKIIEKKYILLPKGAQGYKVYDERYKIVWRYMNTEKFHFCDENVMINHNWILISSDNKKEMEYIFAILNSKMTSFAFFNLMSSDNEKSFQIGIKSIKEFCRIPRINAFNEKIKIEIISMSEQLLKMEKQFFSDIIDFKGILLQKYETAEVIGNTLHLRYKDKEAKCKIKDNVDLVKGMVSNLKSLDLFNEDGIGSVSELKSLSAFDKEYQAQIKNYIDDLVYALYFKIKLPELGFENAEEIKKTCAKHKYYELVNSN